MGRKKKKTSTHQVSYTQNVKDNFIAFTASVATQDLENIILVIVQKILKEPNDRIAKALIVLGQCCMLLVLLSQFHRFYEINSYQFTNYQTNYRQRQCSNTTNYS